MNKVLVKARVIALLFALAIIAGSSVPGDNVPHIFKLTPDKFIHCLEYAALAIFIFRWLRLEFKTLSISKINNMVFLLGSGMGAVDENYQRLIPGRHPDFWDWVLDCTGVLLAIAITSYLSHRSKNTVHKKGS